MHFIFQNLKHTTAKMLLLQQFLSKWSHLRSSPKNRLTFYHGELCCDVPDALTYCFHWSAACLWAISATWNWMLLLHWYLHWMNDCSRFRCYLCFLKTGMKWGKTPKREGSKVACWKSCVFFLKWRRVNAETIPTYSMLAFVPIESFFCWPGGPHMPRKPWRVTAADPSESVTGAPLGFVTSIPQYLYLLIDTPRLLSIRAEWNLEHTPIPILANLK